MHPGRPFVLFGAASVVAILFGSFLLHAYQAAAPAFATRERMTERSFTFLEVPRRLRLRKSTVVIQLLIGFQTGIRRLRRP